MKKIFTLTIVSLMLLLTVVNSCSKSSDTPAPTPTPTPTPTSDSNTVTIDGGTKQEITTVGCTLAGGSSKLFTMSAVTNDNNTTLQITTYNAPAASGTFNVKFSQPSAASDIQIFLLIGPSGAQAQYAAAAGTATVTVAASPSTGIKVAFTNLTFSKSGLPDKKASGTLICN